MFQLIWLIVKHSWYDSIYGLAIEERVIIDDDDPKAKQLDAKIRRSLQKKYECTSHPKWRHTS